MMQASFSAKAAMVAQQRRLDTIGNNLSNVGTVGFKARRATFSDLLYSQMTNPSGEQGNNLQRGSGAALASTNLLLDQGITQQTGVSLDFYIEGQGFFAVQNTAGETLYTRNGAFALSVEQDGRYLVTGQGYYVLNEAGQKIQIPEGKDLSVSPSGQLFMDGTEFAKLNVSNFPNPYGLEAAGNSCFRETEASGAAAISQVAEVKNGALESSNVDTAQEMVNLIKTQRAYQFASKCITTVDEMSALANNMRS